MKDFLKKNKIVVTVGIFFFVFIPLFIFLVTTIKNKIEQKSGEIRSVNIDQELNQEFIFAISTLKENEKKIEEGSDGVNVLLSGNTNAKVNLFSEIEALAKKSGNSSVEYAVLEARPEPKKKDNAAKKSEEGGLVKIDPQSVESIRLQIKTTGTYGDFLEFLHKVENLNYVNDVLGFSIVARENDVDIKLRRASASEEVEVLDQRKNLADAQITIAIYLDTLIEQKVNQNEDDDKNAEKKKDGESESANQENS